MLLFRTINNTNVLDAIYTIASYAYGPLLGLFAFGILFKRKTNDQCVPYICLLSPVLCFAMNKILDETVHYQFGYELLIVNAALVLIGLLAFSKKKPPLCR
jgi:hypothetical protein